MSNTFYFLGQFLRHPARVAAVAPSSKYLARAMLQGIDLRPGDVVVEYGPGTGAFTREVAPLVERGVRYLGIEMHPDFHRCLQQRFPALTFVHGSAEDVDRYLAEHGLPAPRAVISGLPLAAMPAEAMTTIVERTRKALAPGGQFRQFSYVHFYVFSGALGLRQLMKRFFPVFTLSRPVFRNMPPAFVYGGRC